MSTATVLLLAPLAIAAVLTATASRPGPRHRGPRAESGRSDKAGRPRHARTGG
ncbi:hypothetical protein ACGFX4_29370 [Kitasatospora sp. NPDC048365]|uniref:hypothetical protein n=1 Tax=Kitasatospora sp. NPDC048365 TaxID=3364050 RepID=UPI003720D709